MSYSCHSPPSSLGSPSSPPRQNKAVTQKQYRGKETECFNALRDCIKELTGEEVQKRQEILRKATDLLLTISATRRQRSPTLYKMLPFTANLGDMTTGDACWGSLAQSPDDSLQTWPIDINAEFHTQFYDHQHDWS